MTNDGRNPLDMTLEELINANKTNSSQQRGRRGGRGGGRRGGSGGRPVRWRREQRERQVRAGERGGSTVKIYISNLSYKVDNKDIETLFSERGRVILKKSAVHYNE